MSMARCLASPLPTFSWVRRVSTIWRPMLITGFSEYFGSCRIIAMRLPRRLRRSFGGAVSRSMPSKRSLSAEISAFGGVSPMIARPVCDLPEPDSPTMPRRSRPSENEMPRTASIMPVRVGKRTFRSLTSSIVLIGRSTADRARRAGRRQAG
jgi:hypothetical protein